MEAVLRHLNNILELLAVSQTDCVREWDRPTTHRAFKWAEYCEQLHSRYQFNPTVRSVLESGLNDTNRRLRDTFPSYSPVEFTELAQCQHKLIVHLLRNPSAPHFIIDMLFPGQNTPSQELLTPQSSLVTYKSAFSLLCCTLNRTSSYPGLQTEPEVRGKLLGKLLNSVVTRPGNEERAKSLLDSVCRDSAGKVDCFYDVIAGALLSSSDESQRSILSWLKEKDGGLDTFCAFISSEVCAVVSRRSPDFRKLYWGALKQWASCLVYDVTESVWVTSEGAVSFDVLADRLRDLINSGATLKEETETALKALTLQDGDFSVKGVSVWTDLSLQLKL
ncbi:Fanconi anemia group F protein [Danio aesculapii]|uniref:Fanconi anemia group F protein n=1 Tax=Danio aesculapii TaxID=1142201 RepID=UPI0024C09A63|nr:Fanconi anemia group F protein [Danio aesculapii]